MPTAPLIENSLKPFWVPRLNEISGRAEKGLRAWLTDGDYQVYSAIEQESFVLALSDVIRFLLPLAADINRFASAAFESVCQIEQSQQLPRSTAWLVIKSYYAAFFSAHAILRMLGAGVVQIGGNEARCVTEIAKIYGAVKAHPVSKGYYDFEYDRDQKVISFRRITSAKAGAHESFWAIFIRRIRNLSNAVLNSATAPTRDNQSVSAKLDELCDSLSCGGSSDGGWLATMRNDVNYRHGQGVWFPYGGRKGLARQMFNASQLWRSNPMSIQMTEGPAGQLGRFQNTCNFLIALCRSVLADMASRCSTGRSFCMFGPLALLHHLSGVGT